MACCCCYPGNGIGESRAANVATRTPPAPRIRPSRKFWPPRKWRPAAADDRCDRTRLLSTRRETAASAFRESVPRPAYRLPEQSLPRWERTDLNQKLPAFRKHGPEGPLVFHRGPMGSNPLHVDPARDASGQPRFSLEDPYCRDVSYTYNPLHDPHLKGWLASPGQCAFLHRQGLITDDLDVVCSLKEHNEYRRFLGRKHNDAIAAAARDRNAQQLERNRISAAIAKLKKKLDRTLKLVEIKTKKRVPKAVKKKVPKPKPTPVKVKLPKGREVDINEIKAYSEFGRHADGRIDPMEYLGTYMDGSMANYYVMSSAKHFFKRTAESESESDTRTVGIEARPFKCDIAMQAAIHEPLIRPYGYNYYDFMQFGPPRKFEMPTKSDK